ncbi:MAG: PAS domain S-box protein [Pseudomonadota bacterium]
MQGRLSLQERLVLLVLAAVLPLAVLSVWFAAREDEASAARAKSQLKFTASAIASYQDRTVESAQHLLGVIASVPQLRQMQRGACDSFFEDLRGRYPVYANIGVLDAGGKVICSASASAGVVPVRERSAFAQAVSQRRFAVGDAHFGRLSGRWVLPFANPLMVDQAVIGVAFVTLDLEHAANLLARMDLPTGAQVMVTDQRGQILMEYPRGATSPFGRMLAQPELLAAAAQAKAVVGELTDAGGKRRIYAAVPGQGVGGENLVSMVSLDRHEATAGAHDQLGDLLPMVGLTLLAGLAAAWWVGGRVIVKPTKQILGAVRRLEQGKLDARVPLQSRSTRGEFMRIGAAFNLMAESLQLRQADLEAELGRSRSAYAVLDTVLNSMQEGLVAVDRMGQLMMVNRAAEHLFPLEGAKVMPEDWPRHFGLYRPGTQALFEPQDMPFARAMRGARGELLVLARNALIPQGRLLRCSYQPLYRDDGISGALVVFTDVTALERAEADLVLLRNAVARLNDIVLITLAAPLDSPGPRIVFVNEAFERLTGYSAREAIGQTPRMLQGPDTDRATLDRIRAALAQGLPVREELVNHTKQGRPFWVELDIVPMADEAGQYTHWIAVQRDVTARKQAEQALLAGERELQDFSRMLQRSAEAAQAIVRHQVMQPTMQEVVEQARRVIGAHQAVLSLTTDQDWAQVVTALSLSDKYAKWRAAEISPPDGSGIYALVCETNRPLRLTQAELTAHPRWRNFGSFAARHLSLRGLLAVPLVNGRGENIGLLQLSDKFEGDFNERDEYVAIELAQLASISIENARLFEQIRELNANLESRIVDRTAELARQEKRYRALAEQAPEVVWNVDPDGQVTYLNRAWYELVGGTPADWLGEGWLSAIHPEDLAQMREGWARSRARLEPFNGMRRIYGRDGAWHTTFYRAAPVLDEQGRVEFWVGIDSDITELKAIEAALRDTNAELEAFSYSVSHDLRAPLGAIGGFSKALAQRIAPVVDEKARHYVARIEAGVVKMEELIEAMLALSRVTRTPLSHGAVDLSAIARETVDSLRIQAPQREADVQVQDGLQVQGDARLLRVLLENLLGNAWKFTAGAQPARIEVGRADDGVFFVRDNGVGFDMAYAGKLFTAFQRLHTESEFPGTGIGLATVRRIVARHRGKVWVESVPGVGTVFHFTLGGAPEGEAPAGLPRAG